MTTAPRVLIAPDKFKGTLTAAQVGAALRDGVVAERPDAEVRVVPIADGGDGTLLAAEAAGFTRQPVEAAGPLGEPVSTFYARRGDEAVVELAEIAGLARLSDLAPLTSTTLGLGQAIAAALDAGCRRIVVGLGGSSSTDGGAGLLAGLGARLLDDAGHEIPAGGAGLPHVARLDLGGLHPALREAQLVVATDVDNPLTGPQGAAAVYAPQKGATPEQVSLLDAALGRWADVVAAATGTDLRDSPGAGAAGGAGFALTAVLGAERRPGADLVFDLVGLPEQVAWADLVVTGEGGLDEQTLRGKGPGAVAQAAVSAGKPAVAVAGQVALEEGRWRAAGLRAAYSLVEIGGREAAWHDGPAVLEHVGRRIAREHLS